jgi:sterol 3beta-glucosyltransferase
MQFVLVTTGSMGDVQPFLALGLGLQQAGHRVRLAGPEDARGLCVTLGVEFYPIDQEHQKRLHDETSASLERGNTLRFGLQRIQAKRDIFGQVNRAAWRACQGAEAIIYRIGGFLAVDSIAERLGVACFKAGLVPYTPTRAFPSLYVYRGFDLGAIGNRLSYTVSEQGIWQFFRETINIFRQEELGLKPHPFNGPARNDFGSRLAVLYGFSPAILSRPDDWPAHVYITGHWDLARQADWQPSQDLLDFLEAGPPPVYVGFGSMVSQRPQEFYELVVEAIRRCGQRAVLASGGGKVEGQQSIKRAPAEMIYSLDHAPHDWLFPRMAAVVHHGGIGTTTAGLRAGVPNVVVPFNYDQPFWGATVARLGAGPAPVPRQKLSAERLAQAIRASLENPRMRQRAEEISRQMRAEDGVAHAVGIIQKTMQMINHQTTL